MAAIFELDDVVPLDGDTQSNDVLQVDERDAVDSAELAAVADGAAIPPDPSKAESGELAQPRSPRSVRLGQSYEVGIESNFFHKLRKRSPTDFGPLKCLGTGAYGKVLLVKDKVDKRLYAQKQLKKASIVVEQRRMEQTMSERSILKAVRHPYIVKLYYALQDHEKVYLILQYAPGGELFTHLAAERMLSEDVAAFYGAQITSALEHLHSIGIVYRDLKPENCLLDGQGNLLLTDFGLSKVAEDGSTCNSLLGTPEYMAPEVLLGKEYDYSVDWWSLGAVLFDLLTGAPPFTGNNHKKILDKICNQKLNVPYYLSADAKDLLIRLLRKEPKRRLDYSQIDKIKKHRFFRKINWKHIDERSPELDPPIRPIITDPELAENFSSDFTELAMSPTGEEQFHNFKDFSYVGSVDFGAAQFGGPLKT